MVCKKLCVPLLLSLLHCCTQGLESYDLLYDNGIEAYYRNDYQKVVYYMEMALSSYSQLRQTKISCRVGCRQRHSMDLAQNSWDLSFSNVVLSRAACVNECEESSLGPVSRHKVSEDIKSEFYRRIPYNYLQRAYFKLNQLDKAAEAAHTFFMANPEHMEMKQNLANYHFKSDDHLVDRERCAYMEDYHEGVRLYDTEQYTQAIEKMEEALKGYFRADAECRALCGGPQKFEDYEYVGYSASFYERLADHYIQILACEHECVRDLSTRPGRLSPIENFLPLHYDFLQFSYYRVGDHVKALECAKSYLLFHPDDADVSENVSFYESLLAEHMDPPKIQPRTDAAEFVRRHRLEAEILISAAGGLGFTYYEPDFWVTGGDRQDENRLPSGAQTELTDVTGMLTGKKAVQKVDRDLREGGPLLYDEVKLVYNSDYLNGTQRVQLDNVISEEECQELQGVANTITIAGDGYRGKTSPHTPNEKFEGATVLKALTFGYEGRVPMKSARLFYDVSEKARKIVQSYFMLNTTLFFSYTHLVCRTALLGQQDHRNDLSHPIHADNCLLDPEANECWKEAPAYTYRDYSALLYLNGDFDGGEFVFTEMDAKTITASVKPKCGRLVGFSSGGENPHGVRAVTNGQRCAVALWFTLDPMYRELERLQADEVIRTLDKESHGGGGGAQEMAINPRDEL
ncbi:prolyl 3-hydroxylase 2 isoform X2 [Bombina bombina]|uniref:prolyl 3-hydroxylase 2 isoform X2 n=1 Tax=Bombina bombina TaxID=8345 RepID=UPI00235A54BF|nr:prolyl 3-hydroxylase 2 isoform X2 [Bombina bombina]